MASLSAIVWIPAFAGMTEGEAGMTEGESGNDGVKSGMAEGEIRNDGWGSGNGGAAEEREWRESGI